MGTSWPTSEDARWSGRGCLNFCLPRRPAASFLRSPWSRWWLPALCLHNQEGLWGPQKTCPTDVFVFSRKRSIWQLKLLKVTLTFFTLIYTWDKYAKCTVGWMIMERALRSRTGTSQQPATASRKQEAPGSSAYVSTWLHLKLFSFNMIFNDWIMWINHNVINNLPLLVSFYFLSSSKWCYNKHPAHESSCLLGCVIAWVPGFASSPHLWAAWLPLPFFFP